MAEPRDAVSTRRAFLARAAAGGLGLTAAGAVGGLFASSGPAGAFRLGGYGALVSDPNGILDLPSGFRYRIVSKTGLTTMTDGAAIPGSPDGMGAFADGQVAGGVRLVRNHELAEGAARAVPKVNGTATVPTYDPGCAGGTTTVVLDGSGQVTDQVVSLAGTSMNCAGGVTPWGTWLTCEETEVDVGGIPHGYVFEVDPTGAQTDAVPYKAMGRFPHEAVAIDPDSGSAYLTEDSGPSSLLYRFDPTDRSGTFGSLGNGGTLLAMKVPGYSGFHRITTTDPIPGVTWTPVPNPNGVAVPQDRTTLKFAFADADVTRGQKLEGIWWSEGQLWFTSSFNDQASTTSLRHRGQVFRYDPIAGTLTLLLRIPADVDPATSIHDPDNLTATPFGGAIACTDGASPNYLTIIDGAGGTSIFAKARQSTELAGVAFSPDGRTLYVNLQSQHTTLAITGPFARWVGPRVVARRRTDPRTTAPTRRGAANRRH